MDDEPDSTVEYVPPKSDTILAYARSVCEALAIRTNDPIFTQPYVIRGLAAFLEIAARAQANRLNAQQLVDKGEE
jgi:hypothetical protein